MSENRDNREELEARIAAYIDGQLPPAEAARLEVFVANTDPQLAEQIIGMLGDRHRIRGLAKPVAPPDIVARVMEQVERATLLNDSNQIEHTPRRWYQSRAAIAAGVAVLVGGFSWFVVNSVITPKHDDPLKPISSNEPTIGAPAHPKVSADAGPRERTAAKPGGASKGGAEFEGGTLASASPKDASSGFKKAGLEEGVVLDEEKANLAEPVVQQRLNTNKSLAVNGHGEAVKLGYSVVDSPQLALSNISSNIKVTRTEPIVMTLVARDQQDYERLRATLEELITQDPAVFRSQFALLSRYSGNNTVAAGARRDGSQAGGEAAKSEVAPNAIARGKDPENAVTTRPASEDRAAEEKNQPVAKTADAKANLNNETLTNSNYNIYNPKQRNFEVVDNGAAQNPTAPNTIAANTAPATQVSGGVIAQQPAAAPGATASAAQATTQGATQTASDRAQRQGNVNEQRAVGGYDARNNDNGSPLYRVTLRQEQLQQLAGRFRVDSVTCGSEAYVIANTTLARGTNSKSDATQGSKDYAGKEGGAVPAAKDDHPVGGTGTLSLPPAPQAPATAPHQKLEELQKAGEVMEKNAAATQQRAEQPQAQVDPTLAQQKQKEAATTFGNTTVNGPWVEAIITMEPPPPTQPTTK